MKPLVDVFRFLLEHADLVELVMDVIEGGADKANVMALVRQSMIATSDAAMREELKSSG